MPETYAKNHYENNVDFIPEMVEGKYDIPFIKPESYDRTLFLPFHQAPAYHRRDYGVHFFISDYRFQFLWNNRKRYERMLKEFRAVASPDFSIYVDWPIMVQMWNHYRKHLLGAWMQSIGCKVYPTITWGYKESYDFCFDGEPYRSTVCVSSVGVTKSKEMRKMFLDGYEKMLEVLEPETILFHGIIPPECGGNIVPMEELTRRFKEKKHDSA